MEPWKRVTTGDLVTEQLQDNVEPLMRKVQDAFLLDGVLLKKETISGKTFIRHGLGRAPIGYIVIRRRGAVTVTSITGATQANPCVVTSASHGLGTGVSATISGVVGMTELNENVYTITKVSDDTFSLNDVNSSAFTAYASGGTVESIIATTIYDDQENNKDSRKTLKLNSSSSVEVDLWVF